MDEKTLDEINQLFAEIGMVMEEQSHRVISVARSMEEAREKFAALKKSVAAISALMLDIEELER